MKKNRLIFESASCRLIERGCLFIIPTEDKARTCPHRIKSEHHPDRYYCDFANLIENKYICKKTKKECNHQRSGCPSQLGCPLLRYRVYRQNSKK